MPASILLTMVLPYDIIPMSSQADDARNTESLLATPRNTTTPSSYLGTCTLERRADLYFDVSFRRGKPSGLVLISDGKFHPQVMTPPITTVRIVRDAIAPRPIIIELRDEYVVGNTPPPITSLHESLRRQVQIPSRLDDTEPPPGDAPCIHRRYSSVSHTANLEVIKGVRCINYLREEHLFKA